MYLLRILKCHWHSPRFLSPFVDTTKHRALSRLRHRPHHRKASPACRVTECGWHYVLPSHAQGDCRPRATHAAAPSSLGVASGNIPSRHTPASICPQTQSNSPAWMTAPMGGDLTQGQDLVSATCPVDSNGQTPAPLMVTAPSTKWIFQQSLWNSLVDAAVKSLEPVGFRWASVHSWAGRKVPDCSDLTPPSHPPVDTWWLSSLSFGSYNGFNKGSADTIFATAA